MIELYIERKINFSTVNHNISTVKKKTKIESIASGVPRLKTTKYSTDNVVIRFTVKININTNRHTSAVAKCLAQSETSCNFWSEILVAHIYKWTHIELFQLYSNVFNVTITSICTAYT